MSRKIEIYVQFRENEENKIVKAFGERVDDKTAIYNMDTIKPIQFVKDMIFNSTKKGDVVLDTFMGSGTTAVACKELDRHYVGFELNPKYYQIAIDRVNGITKEDREALDKGQLTLF